MLTDIKSTLAFITGIMTDEVIPYFDANRAYSASDLSAVNSLFLTLQNKLIDLDTKIDSDYTIIEQSLSNIPSSSTLEPIITRSSTSPTASINPPFGLGAIWINTSNGEIFICVNVTQNKNLWLGSKGSICGYNPRILFDVFGDNSCLALYRFNLTLDEVGGLYPASSPSGINYIDGKFDKALFVNSGKLTLPKALMPSNSLNYAVSFWIKPLGTLSYVLSRNYGSNAVNNGVQFQLNANKSFTFYFPLTTSTMLTLSTAVINEFSDVFFHHVVISVERDTGRLFLYVDGNLSFMGTGVPMLEYDNGYQVCLGGNTQSTSSVCIQQLRFFNRKISASEAKYLFTEGGLL